MRSTKSADLIGHDKFLSWRQLHGCSVTRPFSLLRRVWLARLIIFSGVSEAYLTRRYLASFPGSCAGEEEREPGTHCLRMRQIPLVTCILLRYTKITVNFCLPSERLHCLVILPVRYIRAVLKSKTISL